MPLPSPVGLLEKPDPMAFDRSVRILDEGECVALLQSRELGRIAFESNGRVEIFPVNYGMEGVIVVVRTGPGTKLDAVAKTEVVFEVDSWDAGSGVGWSVVARGPAAEVTTNIGRVAEHLRCVPVHPAAPGERWHWIGIKPTAISGRRFHVPPATRERA
jgi:nitroimidazol reductase NimA-like FMN-containing flavoprotein (pyridoxamine 5'-phosphate oxidase superfamily)